MERGKFERDQFVIVNELGLREELATVDTHMGGEEYEVTLLRDHEPGEWDPIRAMGGSCMRAATLEEIEAKKKEWEEAHGGHKLSFKIVSLGYKVGVDR